MSNNLAILKRDIVDAVEDKVQKLMKNGELHLPRNYSAPNALKAAWLVLQDTKDKGGKPVLKSCTQDSIANSLFYMIMMGLNPQKKQCDFIAYGPKLTCQPEYTGNIALCKRKAGAKEVHPHVIYKEDEFEYDIDSHGIITIIKHKQSFQNRVNADYIGGYCVIEWEDDRQDHVEIMTMDEIESAWKQGPMYNSSGDYKKNKGTHGKFTEEMIKKSTSNRATKRFIRSSDDSDLFLEAYNNESMARTENKVHDEIDENANSQSLDIEYEVAENEPDPAPEEEKAEDKSVDNKVEEPGF